MRRNYLPAVLAVILLAIPLLFPFNAYAKTAKKKQPGFCTVRYYDTVAKSTIKIKKIKKGESALPPCAPKHKGYKFVKWSSSGKKIRSNITIKTIYRKTTTKKKAAKKKLTRTEKDILDIYNLSLAGSSRDDALSFSPARKDNYLEILKIEKERKAYRRVYAYLEGGSEKGYRLTDFCHELTVDEFLDVSRAVKYGLLGVDVAYMDFSVSEYNRNKRARKVLDNIAGSLLEKHKSMREYTKNKKMTDKLASAIFIYEISKRLHYDHTENTEFGDGGKALTSWYKGAGICQAYAKLYKEFCNSVGIPCEFIYNKEHIWNRVYLGGKWYLVDLTYYDDYIDYGLTFPYSKQWLYANSNWNDKVHTLP